MASSYSKDLALNVILGTLLLPGPLPDSFGMRGRSGKSENASSWCESDRCRTSLTDFARFREPIFGFEVFRLNEVVGGPRVEDRRRDRRFSWRSISGIKILKTILETRKCNFSAKSYKRFPTKDLVDFNFTIFCYLFPNNALIYA